MKLQDLENGMIVTLKYGNECLLMENKLISNNFRMYSKLDYYNENLTCRLNEQDNIMKVQSFNKVDTLWERKEIDWSKVAFGTKVRVWNDEDKKYEGRFLEYHKEDSCDTNPYLIYVRSFNNLWWRNCELIEEVEVEVDIPTYGEIDIAFEQFCRGQENGCSKCEIRAENCEIEYILKNYNVTKK